MFFNKVFSSLYQFIGFVLKEKLFFYCNIQFVQRENLKKFLSVVTYLENFVVETTTKFKMALRITGGIVTKTLKSNSINPFFLCVPSTTNLQVRYAARKGYREKARKKQASKKAAAQVPQKEMIQLKHKFVKIEKTVEPDLPDPTKDDVFLIDHFKPKKYSMAEAVRFHQEYHHPSVYNNPTAGIFTKIEFNMIGIKKTKVIKPFRGLAPIPHPFNIGMKREILVFCGPEYVQEAVSSGATLAGGVELVAKVKTGYVQPMLYEYVLCHVKFLPDLTPIRGILKGQMPRPKSGTLTSDLSAAIPRFLHGVEYSCIKMSPSSDFGLIDCQVGTVDMPPEHVEANFQALVDDFQQFRPNREGSFVSYISCRSPPSKESFAIDVSLYEKETSRDDDDDEDDDDANEISEKAKLKQMLNELEEAEENKLMNN